MPQPPHEFLAETLLSLCATPSPIGDEKALCDALFLKAQTWGRTTRVLNSFVVDLVGAEANRPVALPRIALVGHLDTVRTENGPARREGDRLVGAGAADMKSGLAVMIALAEHAKELREFVDLSLVFYSKEEGPFAENELGPLLDAVPSLSLVDLAVCLEPSDNRLHLGCCGSLHATVTFRGRTAHSARPWEGENAVVLAAPLLLALAQAVPEEEVLEGLTYRTVTTVTKANDGGRGRNIVPDTFVLNLNHRFAPSRSVDDAATAFEAWIRSVAPTADIEFTDRSPGARPAADHPLVRALMAAGVSEVAPKQAWTDVARFSARGVAAINFGPGENAQAHQKNESTSLALVDAGYMIIYRWLRSLGGATSAVVEAPRG